MNSLPNSLGQNKIVRARENSLDSSVASNHLGFAPPSEASSLGKEEAAGVLIRVNSNHRNSLVDRSFDSNDASKNILMDNEVVFQESS